MIICELNFIPVQGWDFIFWAKQKLDGATQFRFFLKNSILKYILHFMGEMECNKHETMQTILQVVIR